MDGADTGHALPTTSSESSLVNPCVPPWSVTEVERAIPLNSHAPVTLNGGNVSRVPSLEDHADERSRCSSSSNGGLRAPGRPDDELYRFLQENVSLSSFTSTYFPSNQLNVSPRGCDTNGYLASIPFPMSFFPSTARGAENGMDGGPFPFLLADHDISDAWGNDLLDWNVPDEFFLRAP